MGLAFSYGTTGIPDGSVALPSIRFAEDQDTGFYKPAASQLGIAVDGSQVMLITATAITLSLPFGAITITATSANALAVGRQGTTNPAFNVNTNTALSVTGINIVANAAGSGIAMSATSSAASEALFIDALGSGVINIATVSTGATVVGVSGTGTGATFQVNRSAAGRVFDVINGGGTAGAINIGLPSTVGTIAGLRISNSQNANSCGLDIVGSNAGVGVFVSVRSTDADEILYIDARGSSGVVIGSQVTPFASHTIDGGLSHFASVTVASAAGATWDGLYEAGSLTLSGSTNITNATGVNRATFEAPTISAAQALTVTNAATVAIVGPPTGIGAGPATITNAYSLWVQSGRTLLGRAGVATGSLLIAGATSGTVTLTVAATAGTWTWTLPVNDGNANDVLITDGAGISSWTAPGGLAVSWSSLVDPTAALALTMAATEETTFTIQSTTQRGFTWTSSTLTSGGLATYSITGSSAVATAASNGSAMTLSSTTTGFTAATQSLLGIYASGANTNNGVTITGATISVTNTNGVSGTNVALTLTASGATTANTALNVTAGGTTLVAMNASGLITGTLGLTITGAAVSLNASSNFAVNIATGTSTGAITIGNSVAGAVNITSNAASTFSFATGAFILETTSVDLTVRTVTSGTLAVTSAGTLALTGVALTHTSTGAATWTHSGGAFAINSTSQSITLATITSGAIILTSAGSITPTSAGAVTWTHSGGAFALNSTSQNITLATVTSGTIALSSAGAVNLTSEAASTWTHSGGAWALNSTSQNVTVATITSGTIAITSAGALNPTSAAASTWTHSGGAWLLQSTSQNITLQTVTSGTIALTSVGKVNLTSADASTWTHSGGAWELTSTSQNVTISTVTSGVLALTSAGAYNETAAAASTFVNVANTALAWRITDGTANYYALDTRTGVTAVISHTLSAAEVSFASATGSAYSLASIAAHTLTLTGAVTPVTALDGLGLLLAAPTVSAASAVVTTDASTLFVTAPIAAGVGPASFTNPWAIQTAGHIGPDADNTYTLGNAARRWSNIFAASSTFGDVNFANGWLLTEGNVVGLDPADMIWVSPTGRKYRMQLIEVA